MQRPLRNALALVGLVVLLLVAGRAIAQSQIVTMGIDGNLNRGHVTYLRAAIDKIRGDTLPTGLIIVIDSAGGDGRAAMDMGRLAREAKAHVFVKGTCRSACVFLLAGAVYRDARPFSIGIHRGRITRNVPGKGEVVVDVEANPEARGVLEVAEREARDYFDEMGMPARLWEEMQKVPTNTIKLLRTDEALALGLQGFDAKYLDRVASTVAPRFGISREQLVARTARVRERCEQELGDSGKFLACYRPAILKE